MIFSHWRESNLVTKRRVCCSSRFGEPPKPEVIRERLKKLRAYRWSSYRQYVGVAGRQEWMHMGAILSCFGTGLDRRKAYRQYVEEEIRAGQQESPWEELRAGFALGGEEWIEKIGKLVKCNPQEQSGLKQLERTVGLEAIQKRLQRRRAKLGRTSSIEREIRGAMPRFACAAKNLADLSRAGPLGGRY